MGVCWISRVEWGLVLFGFYFDKFGCVEVIIEGICILDVFFLYYCEVCGIDE